MTWIKICGITNLEDAQTAVDAGADALGFVFYEKSPRRIDPSDARNIILKLPQNVEKVGVFVHGVNDGIGDIAQHAGVSATQIHVIPSLLSKAVEPAIPAELKQYWAFSAGIFSAKDESGWTSYLAMKKFDAIFLDSGTDQQPGGTGKVFDWGKTAAMIGDLKGKIRMVVAGGLTSENVSEAIRIMQPWGVDVSSGVEATPGKKNPDKVRAFVQAVRRSENN